MAYVLDRGPPVAVPAQVPIYLDAVGPERMHSIPKPISFFQVATFERDSLKHSTRPILRRESLRKIRKVPSHCLVDSGTAARPDWMMNAGPKTPTFAFPNAHYRHRRGESILFFEQPEQLSPKNGISRRDTYNVLINQRDIRARG